MDKMLKSPIREFLKPNLNIVMSYLSRFMFNYFNDGFNY